MCSFFRGTSVGKQTDVSVIIIINFEEKHSKFSKDIQCNGAVAFIYFVYLRNYCSLGHVTDHLIRNTNIDIREQIRYLTRCRSLLQEGVDWSLLWNKLVHFFSTS